MIDDKNQFNPIEFLGLQQLSPKQKNQLYLPILADMATHLINFFCSNLTEVQLNEFLKKIETINDDPILIIKLMDSTIPDFENKKMDILDNYRINFKLQQFQNYL